jgi:hypothetical protein
MQIEIIILLIIIAFAHKLVGYTIYNILEFALSILILIFFIGKNSLLFIANICKIF